MIEPHSRRKPPIVLVDDEESLLVAARLTLHGAGLGEIATLADSRELLPLLAERGAAVVVLDLQMPYLSGVDLLPQVIRDYPQVPVIVATANDDIDTVVGCMKAGAFDYLVKPVETSRLLATVKNALELRDLSSELSGLKERLLDDRLEQPEAFAAIVSGNKRMRALFQYAEVVAKTRQPIMISGETGVGKELVARAIHAVSGCRGDFVAINVAGLDDNLFTDTLFGHKKGAFTGAEQAREGLIARAAAGTLFLDEIGDLNEASQIKLLRLLQEQEYYPVGSDLVRKSDARIVLATNRDLQTMVAAGTFRKDLYYRLFAHRIQIPPLRERADDVALLLEHYLETASRQLHKKKPTPPPELAQLLTLYPFPGNVRELEALVIDAVARHQSGILSMESFREVIGDLRPSAASAANPGGDRDGADGSNPLVAHFGHFPTLLEVEEYLIAEAMTMARGNQGLAAKILGMGRQTLNKRLQKDKR
ncbi:MAG: two-component system response regulator [Desulfuromonadales bacterium GWD2_61_12]|nr:MAG: two-component system response regulator [Desulfuromonadales bacterium GWD2_61_12]